MGKQIAAAVVITLLCGGIASADEPQTSSPSDVVISAPPPPPPFPPAPVPGPAMAQPSEPSRFRFAPTLSLLVVNVSPVPGVDGWQPLGLPSLRTGLRFATLQRSLDDYSMNVGIAGEVGLEHFRGATVGHQYAFGVTVRGGPAAVTRGGLFIPFFDTYGLVTLGFPGGAPAMRFGLGAHFNTFAVLANSLGANGGSLLMVVLLAALCPMVEFVYTPPNRIAPQEHWFEIRFGAGF